MLVIRIQRFFRKALIYHLSTIYGEVIVTSKQTRKKQRKKQKTKKQRKKQKKSKGKKRGLSSSKFSSRLRNTWKKNKNTIKKIKNPFKRNSAKKKKKRIDILFMKEVISMNVG